MSRDKQISEMAKVINESDILCDTCGESTSSYCADAIAAIFVDKGYRKSTDLAEEIFAEIGKSIADLEYRANTPRKTVKVEELKEQVNWVLHEVVPKTLAELKKKYTEEGK